MFGIARVQVPAELDLRSRTAVSTYSLLRSAVEDRGFAAPTTYIYIYIYLSPPLFSESTWTSLHPVLGRHGLQYTAMWAIDFHSIAASAT